MTAKTPRIVRTTAELRRLTAEARAAGRRTGLVPTMGALHAGHASLVERSARECAVTIVTVFVNPTQFGPNEDFQRYPRTLEADAALVGRAGGDVVYAPAVDEVYRPGHATFVEVRGAAESLEGAFRPGHFRGVATVVLKLFERVGADVAYFGQKDFQQSLVVRQMVRDFDLPIEICVCPTVREPDGLALSSRNAYLSADERRRATVISRALRAAHAAVAAGERDMWRVRDVMQQVLAAEPAVRVQYAVVADAETLAEPAAIDRPCAALIAAHVGTTRLIDNVLLDGPCPIPDVK